MINKQDYINSINQNIDIVRGDTLNFNFAISGLGENDEPNFIFSVADEYGEAPVVQADSDHGIDLVEVTENFNEYSVIIEPVDTASLPVTIYYYSLVMELDGEIYTLMRGDFTLLHDVERG